MTIHRNNRNTIPESELCELQEENTAFLKNAETTDIYTRSLTIKISQEVGDSNLTERIFYGAPTKQKELNILFDASMSSRMPSAATAGEKAIHMKENTNPVWDMTHFKGSRNIQIVKT